MNAVPEDGVNIEPGYKTGLCYKLCSVPAVRFWRDD